MTKKPAYSWELFLPIANMDANIALILFFDALVGFLSRLVGVGGGFLAFPASGVHMSAVVPLVLGAAVGILLNAIFHRSHWTAS